MERFDLRERSARTGRLVLPPVKARRTCGCCAKKVAAGWVLPNGQSLCAGCEDVVARADLYIAETGNASLSGFSSHIEIINGAPIEQSVADFLAPRFNTPQTD